MKTEINVYYSKYIIELKWNPILFLENKMTTILIKKWWAGYYSCLVSL